MPTPAKSLDELKKSGTYKRNSGRYRGRVAAVEGFVPLGDPPEHFDEREAAAWNEICSRATAGTLAAGDFILVELASKLLVQSRTNWANFSATDKRILQSICNDLGLSPLKRGRVSHAPPPKPRSSFAELSELLTGPYKPPN